MKGQNLHSFATYYSLELKDSYENNNYFLADHCSRTIETLCSSVWMSVRLSDILLTL